jgi:microcystin-dependent protein
VSDPQSTNVGLYLPTRGSDVGTWDSPENANDSATDSLFANVATISLTNANVTLTTPPNTGASWSGPYQSQSGILKFTGTLTGNCTITIPRAGFFIVDNQCVVGAFYVRLGSSAPGKYICAPPGAPTQIYCDGTDVSYVNLGPVGAALDLQGATALPAWMTACTRLPYLVKDGTVYNYSDYPSLGRQLGSTFGGNGITTFGVPDERNRMRLPIDLNVGGFSSRVTTAGSGIDGKTMNSSGGDQLMQQHTHTITDPQHSHGLASQNGLAGGGGLSGYKTTGSGDSTNPASTGITINNAGSGNSQNMVPSIVSFLPLIKT